MHAQRRYSTGTSAGLAMILIGVGLAALWLAVAPGILGGSGPGFSSNLAPVQRAATSPAPLAEGAVLTANLQISQPRDPFRPLITDSGGQLGGPGAGQPSGIPVQLVSVSTEEPLEAVVDVNGVEYTVSVGDTFAGSFKVVSLTPPDEDLPVSDPRSRGSGVFLFGDNAFELTTGQQILK